MHLKTYNFVSGNSVFQTSLSSACSSLPKPIYTLVDKTLGELCKITKTNSQASTLSHNVSPYVYIRTRLRLRVRDHVRAAAKNEKKTRSCVCTERPVGGIPARPLFVSGKKGGEGGGRIVSVSLAAVRSRAARRSPAKKSFPPAGISRRRDNFGLCALLSRRAAFRR